MIHSSPAIGPDGTMYVGSMDGNLYAIHSPSPGPALSSWPMFRRDLERTVSLARPVDSPVLTVARSGGGAASYTRGNHVSLTPVPGRGYIFGRWSAACSGRGTCTVIMGSHKSVDAFFDTGFCTCTLSHRGARLSRLGGTVTVRVTAHGSTYCPPPDIEQKGDWMNVAGLFEKRSGKVVITAPPHGGSTPRKALVVIAGHTFTLTQRGRPAGN